MTIEQIQLEVEQALSQWAYDSDFFEHNLEDSQYTTSTKEFQIESDNFLIDFEITEEAKWDDVDFYELYDFSLDYVKVTDQDGNEYELEIDTDIINY